MTPQSRSFHLSGRWLIISLLVLLGLAASLVGGVVAWQRLHAPTSQRPAYHHTPNAINTGKSILYLSSPRSTSAPTQLTMVRTSDGARRWEYSLSGSLSTSGAPTIGEALANGLAVEVANGIIYFVNDTSPLGGPNREQDLLALRADDGAILWRQPVQAATLELFGVSDGVVCIRVTQQQGSRVVSSALFGYNAQTGALAWQRQGADIIGSKSTQYGVILLDGILYVAGGPLISPSSPADVHALLPSTGQTLWHHVDPRASGSHPSTNFLTPVAADNGVIVFFTLGGSSLVGMQERDGKVLWRYQAATILSNVFHDERNGPGILEHGGALYFGTAAADGSLQLNSLQMTTGRLLWRQPISAAKSALWDLTVSADSVYAITIPQWPGYHPVFDGLRVFSVEMGSGKRRWQDRPASEPAPYFAGAGSVVLYASGSSLTALSPGDGSTLWRRSHIAATDIAAADDTVIFSVVNYTGGATWTSSLCGLQQATGAARWCDQFTMGMGLFVLGP